ncbi:DUF1488 domain-containing protein [Mesorhizobium sp.]|uniref:DUF1488 domain-containing protein n=1 Tax=Mesorhizobium sp. TaxID=1871066 RepID=UPI00120485C0|nr:DUF1488 domain-containing protein [Mesorhizobium sp.]TIO06947.1 MAG: DUF1488 domain-containing protein [Mesorhizobium sp.]TIO35839.1 MAG: DUF1488 domain-containing protein [Mesorhizobium sp.]TIP09628.1 MAG: DUF1488 domain-containing protein [Mesorhizobium sp.]
MTLNFPNGSRSYDAAARRIRFVGHDGMFEVPFFVEIAALSAAGPATSEAEYLSAFDAERSSIQDVAREAYSHGRKNMYVLTQADFR